MNSFIVLNTSEGPPLLIPMKGTDDYATGEMPSLDKQITVIGIHFESPSITITTSIEPNLTLFSGEAGEWRLYQTDDVWELEYYTLIEFARDSDTVVWPIDPKTVTRMG